MPATAITRSKNRKQGLSLSAVRQRSQRAAVALEAFAELRPFFEHDRDLALALGWDPATVAEWRQERVVRPQRAKLLQVLLLRELCEAARAYLDGDRDAGRWVTTPLPNLRGESPAAWLHLHGRRGLRSLVSGLVEWMPTLPDEEPEPLDEELARSLRERAVAADVPGARELERMRARRR